MKTICFFILSGLPIPAVNGGAIETLLQILIDQNEIYHKFKFRVLCVGNSKAIGLSKKYQYTEFVYYKTIKADKLIGMITRRIYRFSRIVLPHSWACFRTLLYLKKNKDFDFLVNETWKVYLSPLIAKVVPKEKIITHIHRKGETEKGDISIKIDQSIGYLLSVSDFISDDWCKETGREADKAFVLKNCCDSKAFQKKLSVEEQIELKKNLNIDEHKVVLIFVGRITAEKGLKELLLAIEKIKSKDSIHLLIVGGSQDNTKTSFEEEIDKIVSDRTYDISQIGYVDNNLVYRYYSISDIAILPSVCPEAAPLTGIEAMTAGVPVITTNMGGIPEYSCDGAAIRVEVDENLKDNIAQAIDELVLNENKRVDMEKCALKQALNFSPEKYYEDFCNIISKVSN